MDHLIILRHERGRKFFVIQAAPQQVFIVFITDIIRDFTVYLSLGSASPDAALQSAHLPRLLHSPSHSSPGSGNTTILWLGDTFLQPRITPPNASQAPPCALSHFKPAQQPGETLQQHCSAARSTQLNRRSSSLVLALPINID